MPKRMYEMEAVVARSERQASVHDAIDDEHRRLAAEGLDDGDGSEKKHSSMLISQSRLSQDEMRQLQALLHSDFVTSQVLHDRHRHSRVCPVPVDSSRFRALQEKSQLDVGLAEGMSSMASRVCRGRGAFNNACFFIEESDGQGQWYRFVTAYQNHMRLVLLPLVEVDLPEPPRLTLHRRDLDSLDATSMS